MAGERMNMEFKISSFPVNSWNYLCPCPEHRDMQSYFAIGFNLVFWQITCNFMPDSEAWGIKGVVGE